MSDRDALAQILKDKIVAKWTGDGSLDCLALADAILYEMPSLVAPAEGDARKALERIKTITDGPTPHSPYTIASSINKIAREALANVCPAQPDPLADVRPEVRAFALLMERELRANDHKPGWKDDSPKALAHRVLEEARELHYEANAYPIGGRGKCGALNAAGYVGKEAADVANMAMMVADVCGALPESPPPPPDLVAREATSDEQALLERALKASSVEVPDPLAEDAARGALRDLYTMLAARPDIYRAIKPLLGFAETATLEKARAVLAQQPPAQDGMREALGQLLAAVDAFGNKNWDDFDRLADVGPILLACEAARRALKEGGKQ